MRWALGGDWSQRESWYLTYTYPCSFPRQAGRRVPCGEFTLLGRKACGRRGRGWLNWYVSQMPLGAHLTPKRQKSQMLRASKIPGVSRGGAFLQTPLSNHGTCCFLALRSVEVIISGLGGWVETLPALSVGIQLKASPESPAAPVFVSRCLPFMLEQGRAWFSNRMLFLFLLLPRLWNPLPFLCHK